MAKGDHIYIYVFGYYHHGIDCGDGTVIHYNSSIRNKANAKIVRTSYSKFCNGKTVLTKKYTNHYYPNVVVQRAISRLGEQKYHLLNNNCEHFATWCKTGERYSHQVNNGVNAAGSSGSTALAGSAAVGVTAIGTAAGVSGGAGIMSGLASVGSVVGGGAVAGIAATGLAPGAIAATTMHKILEDDEGLSQKEREARAAGRTASTAGAVAGTAGAVGAVSAAGAVAGLSGAGITSGLAAIGGTVGGGMLAGVAITAAAPAAAAAGIGFGVYKAWQYLKK